MRKTINALNLKQSDFRDHYYFTKLQNGHNSPFDWQLNKIFFYTNVDKNWMTFKEIVEAFNNFAVQ